MRVPEIYEYLIQGFIEIVVKNLVVKGFTIIFKYLKLCISRESKDILLVHIRIPQDSRKIFLAQRYRKIYNFLSHISY